MPSKVLVEGTLQTRKWVDQDQIERFTTEVVLPKFRGDIRLLDPAPSRDGKATLEPVSEYEEEEMPS
jgi:single-strand DNA-binding protein